MALYVSREEALAHPVRARLLRLVATDPGVNMKDLAARLGCQPSTLIWHYTKLVRAGLLLTHRVGNERVFRLPAGSAAVARWGPSTRREAAPAAIDGGGPGLRRARQ
jgi:DNA-binding transcriptional ArsR family regulator